MLSNQIIKSVIEGIALITRRELTVLDRDGKLAAATDTDTPEKYMDSVYDFLSSQAESQLIQGYQFFKVYDAGYAEFVVVIKGEDEENYRVGKLASFQLQNLLVAYKERFDKDNFIKNLLLDNLLLVDIYSRAKKLRIDREARRIVYLIEAGGEKDWNLVEVVRNIFPAKIRDFVTAIDEEYIILVKELRDKDTTEAIEKTAHDIRDTLGTEALTSVKIAIGTAITDIKNVSHSYKEAKMALEVAKIFDPNLEIINYEKLGIGRLIYQLPIPLCRMYVSEVLRGISINHFDNETIQTVDKFFECHLNVSETSRQLYIHRNTLIYRLDKLQKMTGLDLRNFEDAIIFKITIMVSKYMQYKERYMY
jgi:carbohydrate diacid regulator